MAESPLIQFRAKNILEQALRTRAAGEPESESNPEIDGIPFTPRPTNLSQVASRDLIRYYYLIQRDLPRFPMNEALLIFSAMNGPTYEVSIPKTVIGGIIDDMELNHSDEYYSVNRTEFTAKLKALSNGACVAIVDALERAWGGRYHIEDTRQALIDVGLAHPEKSRQQKLERIAQENGFDSLDAMFDAIADGKFKIEEA